VVSFRVERRKAGVMPGRVGSTTPEAPRSGARGNRFCRASEITGARMRALALGKIGGNRSIVEAARFGMTCSEFRRDGFGSGNSGRAPPSLSGSRSKKRESPAAKCSRRGVIARSVAGFPEGDVGGAVFGRRFQFDEAAAQPGGAEFRRPNFEIHVGLAARLRDLAPAGADLVALPCVDPVIGGLVGFTRPSRYRRRPELERACP
jgi:hypothetical protein